MSVCEKSSGSFGGSRLGRASGVDGRRASNDAEGCGGRTEGVDACGTRAAGALDFGAVLVDGGMIGACCVTGAVDGSGPGLLLT